jgi:PKD repeat protein
VNFNDQCYTSIPVKTYSWDFNNDGVFESTEKNPKWEYSTEGTYYPLMNVFNGRHSHNTNRTVEVFDGETALAFSANSNNARVQPDDLNELSNAFTIEAWINANSIGASSIGTILSKGSFVLSMYSQKSIRVYFKNTSDTNFAITSLRNTIELNKWQHVAVTYDGKKELKLFINGKEQELDTTEGTSPDTLKDNTKEPFYIGNTSDLRNGFDGRIDEVRIWKVKKTQADLIKTMNNSLTGYEQNLQTYWTFEEGKGDTSTSYGKNKLGAKVYSRWGQGWHPGIVKIEPLDQTLCEGTNALFQYQVFTVNDSIKYKWYLNSVLLDLSSKRYTTNNGILQINSIVDGDKGEYKADADIYVGSTITQTLNSSVAALKVLPGANIKSQTGSTASIMETGKLELFVEAEGTEPVYYQWYRDEFPVAGGNMPTLTIENVSKVETGTYYCLITSACGSAKSKPVEVDIFANSVYDDLLSGDFIIKPNPVNDNSEILFELNSDANVECKIYNLLGTNSGLIFSGRKDSGRTSILFNPKDYGLAQGMYIVVLEINGKKLAKPVIVGE